MSTSQPTPPELPVLANRGILRSGTDRELVGLLSGFVGRAFAAPTFSVGRELGLVAPIGDSITTANPNTPFLNPPTTN